jgi:hypothetical protein
MADMLPPGERYRDGVVERGGWWRCDRYELRDGLVVPAARCKLEIYDPWEAYRDAREGTGKKTPPYQSLLSLLERLELAPGPGDRKYELATQSSQQHLLEWCSEHGLLGIGPHRVQMIALWPRWDRPPAETRGPRNREALYPHQVVYFRSPRRWEPHDFYDWRRPRSERAGEAKAGEAIPLDEIAADWPRPGVLIRRLLSPQWRWEPFSESWRTFFRDAFPGNPEQVNYPWPDSEPFCRSYSEPLDDFLHAASALRDGVRALAGDGVSSKAPGGVDPKQRGLGDMVLQRLADPVGPIIYYGKDGQRRFGWASPTLLSSFALMVFQDLGDPQRRVIRCELCGAVFVSGSYQAAYCTERCRVAAYKRRRRAKDRKAHLLRRGPKGPRSNR